MLRDLTDAQKFVITAMTGRQHRCISESGTHIKVSVLENSTSECGKIWPTPLKRNSRKIGEHHLTHMLACGVLEVCVSLSILGNELQF